MRSKEVLYYLTLRSKQNPHKIRVFHLLPQVSHLSMNSGGVNKRKGLGSVRDRRTKKGLDFIR